MGSCTIGVPREGKPQEGRVGITPDGVRALVALGIRVEVELRAGNLSGFSDNDYLAAGAVICSSAEMLYRDADIIVKVRSPGLAGHRRPPRPRRRRLQRPLLRAGVDPEL